MVSGFEVTRRILVDLEGISLRRKWLAGLEPENVHMMIGRLFSGKSEWKHILVLDLLALLAFRDADVNLQRCRLHDH